MNYFRRTSGLWLPDHHLRFPERRGFAQPRYNFLPGHFPAGAVARAEAGTTLAFEASATNTGSDSITIPASVQAGDIIVLGDLTTETDTGNPPTTVVPTGFTEVANVASGTIIRHIVSVKVAESDDAGTPITGMDPVGGEAMSVKIIAVFRGGAESVSDQSVNSVITNGSPSAQTVTSGGGATPLVALGFAGVRSGSSGNLDSDTFTPSEDGSVSDEDDVVGATFLEYRLHYRIFNADPVNMTMDKDDDGNNNTLISFYLEAT